MLAVRDPFRISALLLLPSVLFAASAAALPITLYVDATASTGFEPADVARAVAAGAGAPAVVVGLGDGDGYFHLTTPNGISRAKGKSKKKPLRSTSTWTLHVAPETPTDLLQEFCVVILGHSPNDPFEYKTENVGLAIESDLPWRLVTPWEGGPTYLAYPLGDLAAGRSYEIPIEYKYRLGQKLEKKKGVYYFPLFSVAYLSLPEPSTWVLGLAGVAFAVRARRRPDTLAPVLEGDAHDPSGPRDRVRQWQ